MENGKELLEVWATKHAARLYDKVKSIFPSASKTKFASNTYDHRLKSDIGYVPVCA